MFRLEKEFRFEASHQLKNHNGKCARLHGHSWRFTVVITGMKLETGFKGIKDEKGYYYGGINPKENMLMDYSDISLLVKEIIDNYLDHWHLNDTLFSDMPTSEFIAKWLFNNIQLKLPEVSKGMTNEIRLEEIIVEETCTSKCIYNPHKKIETLLLAGNDMQAEINER